MSSGGYNDDDLYLEVWPEPIRKIAPVCWCPFWICFGIAIILIVSMVPASYSACEYQQWCFKKNSLKNEVDINAVYDNGNRYWGLSFKPLALPRIYQRQDLSLLIFSKTGLEYRIDIVFYWRLVRSRLPGLFRQFGLSYTAQVTSRANAKIKNVAPTFNISQYIENRPLITTVLHKELETELNVIGIEVPPHLFFLTDIFLPDEIKKKNLDAAIQAQKNIEKSNQQEAVRVREETQAQKKAIDANSSLIAAEASATVNRLVTTATADANRTLSRADGAGIEALFQVISATNANVKALYVRYFALLGSI